MIRPTTAVSVPIVLSGTSRIRRVTSRVPTVTLDCNLTLGAPSCDAPGVITDVNHEPRTLTGDPMTDNAEPVALAVREPAHSGISFNDIQRMGKAMAASGLFGFKTEAQAIALLLVSQAEGRHPAMAARDYDIIQGRPAKKAEAMLRDLLASGGSVVWNELSDLKADATFSHPQGGTVRITWDMARVEKAGISNKDMYKKYPRQMLRSRCVSEGVRTVYPAATSGMYVPDEVRDFTAPEKNDPPLALVAPSGEPAAVDEEARIREEDAALARSAK